MFQPRANFIEFQREILMLTKTSWDVATASLSPRHTKKISVFVLHINASL